MSIDERALAELASAPAPDPDTIGWFAARQPAVIRYLEAELGGGSDAFAVALDAVWRLAGAIEVADGVPPARIGGELLHRSDDRRAREIALAATALGHPALTAWLERFVADAPVALAIPQRAACVAACVAVAGALAEVTTGRVAGVHGLAPAGSARRRMQMCRSAVSRRSDPAAGVESGAVPRRR